MQLPQDEGVGRGDFNRKPEFVLPDQVCICRGQLVNLLSKGQAAEGEGKQGCECEDLSGKACCAELRPPARPPAASVGCSWS